MVILMKLNIIQSHEEGKKTIFKGKRVFRNTVAQLAKNNPYSLTEPNQRAISNAISELSKVPRPENVKFLLNTAAKSTYSTNIELENTVLIHLCGDQHRIQGVKSLDNDDRIVAHLELMAIPNSSSLLKIKGGDLNFLAAQQIL